MNSRAPSSNERCRSCGFELDENTTTGTCGPGTLKDREAADLREVQVENHDIRPEVWPAHGQPVHRRVLPAPGLEVTPLPELGVPLARPRGYLLREVRRWVSRDRSWKCQAFAARSLYS